MAMTELEALKKENEELRKENTKLNEEIKKWKPKNLLRVDGNPFDKKEKEEDLTMEEKYEVLLEENGTLHQKLAVFDPRSEKGIQVWNRMYEWVEHEESISFLKNIVIELHQQCMNYRVLMMEFQERSELVLVSDESKGLCLVFSTDDLDDLDEEEFTTEYTGWRNLRKDQYTATCYDPEDYGGFNIPEISEKTLFYVKNLKSDPNSSIFQMFHQVKQRNAELEAENRHLKFCERELGTVLKVCFDDHSVKNEFQDVILRHYNVSFIRTFVQGASVHAANGEDNIIAWAFEDYDFGDEEADVENDEESVNSQDVLP